MGRGRQGRDGALGFVAEAARTQDAGLVFRLHSGFPAEATLSSAPEGGKGWAEVGEGRGRRGASARVRSALRTSLLPPAAEVCMCVEEHF